MLAQTFGDFELLIVDDASTDGAVEKLPDDPRIRVLGNASNIGQIPSLNRGLREARGEYVARLDHDDLCLPRRLELQVDVLDAIPVSRSSARGSTSSYRRQGLDAAAAASSTRSRSSRRRS